MGEATKAVKAVSGYPMPDYFLVRAQVGEPKKSRGYFERRSPFVLDTGFTEPNERTSRAPMKLMDSPSIRWEKNYAARSLTFQTLAEGSLFATLQHGIAMGSNANRVIPDCH